MLKPKLVKVRGLNVRIEIKCYKQDNTKIIKKLRNMMTDELDYLLQDDGDLTKMKEILSDMGIDLDGLDKEFENYTPKRELRYEKLTEEVSDPEYNYPSDSGFDLYSTIDFELKPFERVLVPTGLRFDIPDGTEIQVRPKSGLALKQGLTVLNTPGTVDSGYNGEIKVIIFNSSNLPVSIVKGMKIAQAVLCPVINGKWVDLVKVSNIEDKDRGDNGFGSTGI
jgi:dUTP pyrophosphatase